MSRIRNARSRNAPCQRCQRMDRCSRWCMDNLVAKPLGRVGQTVCCMCSFVLSPYIYTPCYFLSMSVDNMRRWGLTKAVTERSIHPGFDSLPSAHCSLKRHGINVGRRINLCWVSSNGYWGGDHDGLLPDNKTYGIRQLSKVGSIVKKEQGTTPMPSSVMK